MRAAALFFVPEGRLRAPWRLLLFAAATVAGLAIAQGIAYPIASALAGAVGVRLAAEPWLLSLALLIGHALTVHWVERGEWRVVWLDGAAARPRTLLGGFVLGALAIGVPTLLLLGAGWLRVEPADDGNWWEAAWRMSLLLAPAALWEELAFRGYLFAVLRDVGKSWTALTATSVAFGLIHLSNPGADARSTALVVLAGFFLGGVLLATRSLYAAWMAHLGWNWAMAVLFHAPVSGLPLAAPDYRTVDAGPDWATGGVWGPEGGAGAALGLTAGMLYLLVRGGRARLITNVFARRAGRGESSG
jgi:membrane protease YdiL (CAAX protease family)